MAVEGSLGSMVDGAVGGDLSSAPVLSLHDTSDALQVSDPQLLFLGDYSRQGHDLRIDHDGATVLIEDYFSGDPANLAAPNGAFLSADTVKLLAGPLAPGQYAQAAAADAPAATGLSKIGKVVSIEGTATSTHSDGVTVSLKEGDPVYQGDVVQTGAGSKLGISFIDDSVFSMSADARMVLNELIFDPEKASESSMVVNLVQGSFVFVTGQVAPSGDMKVETPVATMGIRGTTPKVLISTELGVTEFTILPDPDSGKIGSYVLLDKVTGEVLGTVESVGDKWVITSLSGEAVKVAKSGLDLLEDEIAMADIRAAVSSALGDRSYIDGANSFQQVAYNSSSSAAGPGGGSTGGNGNGTGNEGGGGVDPTPDKDDAPIAGADAFTTGEEADGLPGGPPALSGNVFVNNGGGVDYDPDGFGIVLIQVNGTPLASWGGTLPSGATLTMNSTGGFTYKPNDAFESLGLGESTTDVFTYTIRDPGGFTGTGHVTMTVTGRNDRPLIEATSVLTDAFSEQTGVTGSATVLTADGAIRFSDVDTTDLHSIPTPVFVSAVWNAGVDPTVDPGSLTIHPVDQVANSVGWTYSIADNAVDFLGVGETLTITYTVTVMDDSGAGAGGNDGNESATSTARQIVVTITGTNDAPQITSEAVTRVVAESSEDGGVGGGFGGDLLHGTLSFTDVDVTDTDFSYEVVSVQEIPNGGALGHPTLDNDQLKALLSLAGSNDSGTTGTDGEIQWAFTGDEDQFDYLAAGESVTLVYTIQVRDEHGAVSNQQTITIKIIGASDAGDNDAPVISVEIGDAAVGGVTETNSGLSTSGTLTVTEIDRTDIVDLSITGMQVSAASTDPSSARPSEAALQAMFSLNKDNVLSDTVNIVEKFGWTFDSGSTNFDYLAEGEKLVLVYTIKADDGLNSDTQTVTITITGTNDAPVITSVAGGADLAEAASQTGEEAPLLVAGGTISFTDVDVSENAHVASVSVAATGVITGLPLNNAGLLALFETVVNQTGTTGIDGSVDWSFSGEDQSFDYLAEGEVLTLTYTVTITDAQGATASQTVTITVTGSNDAPTITSAAGGAALDEISAQTGEDTLLQADGSISFVDVDVSENAHEASVSVAATGTTTGLALDNAGLLALFETAVNQTGATGISGSVDWSFSAGDQAFDYLAEGEVLTLTYTVTVTDAEGATAFQNVTVTITGSNDTPTITSAAGGAALTETANQTGEEAPLLEAGGSISFTDVDVSENAHAASVSVAATGVTGGLVLDNAGLLSLFETAVNQTGATGVDGSVDWSFSSEDQAFDYLAEGEVLTLTYTVTITDAQGATVAQDVTITITGRNDQPVIEESSVLTDAITEQAGTTGATTPMVADGTIVFSDVDTTDLHSVVTPVFVSADWSGGPDPVADPGTLVIGTVDQGANSASWTYTVADGALDYLAAGETLTITYEVAVRDDSATGNGTSSVQQIVVTITGTNDTPVISVTGADSAAETIVETDAGLTTSGTLTVIDADLNDAVTAALDGVATGGTTAGLVPDQAALLAMFAVTSGSIGADTGSAGNLGWSFDSGSEAFDYLAEGEELTLTYTIEVTDGEGATDTQTVTITITGTNDAPVISVSGTDSAAETIVETDAGVTASGTLTVVDADRSDAVTASVGGVVTGGTTTGLVPNQAALLAMLTVTAGSIAADTGSAGNLGWSFDSGSEAFDYLADGEQLTLTYTIEVTDGEGATDTQTVTITITGTNDVPQIGVADLTGGVTELTADDSPVALLTDSGTIAFTDADRTDAHEIDPQVSASAGALGTLTASVTTQATGGASGEITWEYSVDPAAIEYLAAGETKEETFTITLDDGNGGTVQQTVTVIITGSNDAPVITSAAGGATFAEAADQTGVETPLLAAAGTILFSDADVSEDAHEVSVAVEATGDTSGLSLDQAGLLALFGTTLTQTGATGVDGSVAWEFEAGDDTFDYLAEGEELTLTYTVTITDAEGATVAQAVTIVITGANDAPVIEASSSDVTGSVFETAVGDIDPAQDAVATGQIVFSDVDASDAPEASVSPDDALLVFTQAGGGTATLPDGLDAGLIRSAFSIQPDGSWTYDASQLDLEALAAGDTITLTYAISVMDGHGGTDTVDVTITLTGTNDAPAISASGTDSIADTIVETDAGLAASGTLTVTDIDRGSSVTAAVTGVATGGATTGLAPNQAALLAMMMVTGGSIAAGSDASANLAWSFDSGSEAFNYLAEGQQLTLTYTVEVMDAEGATDTQDVTVTITGTNDAPVLTVDASGSVAEDVGETAGMLTDSGTLSIADVDVSDTHTVSGLYNADAVWSGGTLSPAQIAALSAGFTVGGAGWDYSVANADVQFLGAGETVTLSYTVTVTDDSGAANASTSEVVTITITGTNDAPVTGLDFVVTDEDTQFTAGNVLTNDQDPDLSNTLEVVSFKMDGGSTTAAAGTVLQGVFGELTINEDGTFSYELDTDLPAVQGLSGGSATAEQFLYTVQDSSGEQVEERLTISIAGINDIEGDDDPNTLDGTAERDRIYGLGDDDILNGLGGHDTLFGGAGDDQLFGGDGNDILYGGDGSDQLTGGLGADTFVFLTGESGVDTILDFDTGQDFINLDDLLGPGFDPDAPIEISLVDNGSGSDLTVGGDVVAHLDGVADNATINIVYDDTEHFAFSNSMNA